MMKKRTIILLILLLLAIDQTIKIYVKTNFYYGEEYYVFGQDWFRLHFFGKLRDGLGIQVWRWLSGQSCFNFIPVGSNHMGNLLYQ